MNLNSNKHPWIKKPLEMLREIASHDKVLHPRYYRIKNSVKIDDEDEKMCPNCYSHLVHCKEDRYSCPNCGYQYLDR